MKLFPTAARSRTHPVDPGLPVQNTLQQVQCHAPGVVPVVARFDNGTEGGDASAEHRSMVLQIPLGL